MRDESEYKKLIERVKFYAIIALIHGNTNEFEQVQPHEYVSSSTKDLINTKVI